MATPIGIEFIGSLLEGGIYPVLVEPARQSVRKVPLSDWPGIVSRLSTESLRTVAKDHGVSHETIRRILHEAMASHS